MGNFYMENILNIDTAFLLSNNKLGGGKNMKGDAYKLAPPSTPEQWQAYHNMRRKILWENRGRFGVYVENHPDEFLPDNHPMLLFLRDEPIGVVRIDIVKEENRAIMRRVAIKESEQRKGHGRKLVELAEQFARDKGSGS
jgi:GNAT superfamily N-acetyltransferase